MGSYIYTHKMLKKIMLDIGFKTSSLMLNSASLAIWGINTYYLKDRIYIYRQNKNTNTKYKYVWRTKCYILQKEKKYILLQVIINYLQSLR